MDRRKFVKGLATVVPTLGIASAIPSIAQASSPRRIPRYRYQSSLVSGADWELYITDNNVVVVDNPGLPVGRNSQTQFGRLSDRAQSKKVFYSPTLNTVGKIRYKQFEKTAAKNDT